MSNKNNSTIDSRSIRKNKKTASYIEIESQYKRKIKENKKPVEETMTEEDLQLDDESSYYIG